MTPRRQATPLGTSPSLVPPSGLVTLCPVASARTHTHPSPTKPARNPQPNHCRRRCRSLPSIATRSRRQHSRAPTATAITTTAWGVHGPKPRRQPLRRPHHTTCVAVRALPSPSPNAPRIPRDERTTAERRPPPRSRRRPGPCAWCKTTQPAPSQAAPHCVRSRACPASSVPECPDTFAETKEPPPRRSPTRSQTRVGAVRDLNHTRASLQAAPHHPRGRCVPCLLRLRMPRRIHKDARTTAERQPLPQSRRRPGACTVQDHGASPFAGHTSLLAQPCVPCSLRPRMPRHIRRDERTTPPRRSPPRSQ